VEALNKDFQRALADPEVSSRLKALGVDISGAGPQQFLETVKKEVSGWKEIAKQAGVEPE
jgi:tripartite-type tricarboxylate transporter receptor subunit TctC